MISISFELEYVEFKILIPAISLPDKFQNEGSLILKFTESETKIARVLPITDNMRCSDNQKPIMI